MKAEHLAEFEEIYSVVGAWAKLFRKSQGYLGTELLVDEGRMRRYSTIDRWTSSQNYESFLAQWKNEYADLDAQTEHLTEHETLIGRWEIVSPESH